MLVKLCLGSLEEKVVRALSFFRRPCCLVHIVLWVAVSDCCIYVLNDIGNDPFCRSNMNSDTCNLYKSDIFNMLSDLNMGNCHRSAGQSPTFSGTLYSRAMHGRRSVGDGGGTRPPPYFSAWWGPHRKCPPHFFA